MALSWKARRRWAIFVLVIALPLYVVVAVNIVDLFERPSILVETAIYLGLGVLWVLPLRRLFQGVGQPEPDADKNDRRTD